MSSLLAYSSILIVAAPISVIALRHSRSLAFICAVTASGFSFMPFNDVSLIVQLKGVFADLSLTTVVLLTTWPLLRASNISSNGSDLVWLCAVVLILAVALYPMALGVGSFDSYTVGYRPLALLTLIAASGILAVYKSYWISAATVVAVLSGYWFRALPSQNLWDYLLDPVGVILAVIFLLHRLYERHIWRRSGETSRST